MAAPGDACLVFLREKSQQYDSSLCLSSVRLPRRREANTPPGKASAFLGLTRAGDFCCP